MKVPIPDDWQEAQDGYILGMVCVPNSQMWRSLVRGKIQELARGRIWDETTGIIKDAQLVGWAIYDSFMTCKLDDLVLAVQNINNFNEKFVFELARINYNLDRIRDNLDSHAPDGDEETEYGLATILAALGPNVTKSTEFIRHIKEALSTDLVGIPGESGEFAEGTNPALPDVMGHLTSMAADYLGGETLRLQFTMTADTEVLVEIKGVSKSYTLKRVDEPTTTLLCHPSDFPDMGTTGNVRVIDQKFNIFTDIY